MAILKSILNFLFPSYCVVCGRRLLVGEQAICLHCNLKLPRTNTWNDPYNNKLAQRFWGKINPFKKGASYIYHLPHGDSAEIVYDFKYHDRPDVARQIGEMMAQEMGQSGFFDDIDAIIPVPITNKRWRERGYNQCEELAIGITKRYDIPIEMDVIKRKPGIASQVTQTRATRRDNVTGAFYATPKAQRLAGKHCLLLDDIITTGSTLTECCRALESIPGISFSVMSFGCVKNA